MAETKVLCSPRSNGQVPTLSAQVVQERGHVSVVVHGELDLATAPVLRRELTGLLALDATALSIDLQHVDFIDSSGLHALNAVRELAQDRDVLFELCAVPPHARRVLDLTGMTSLFTIAA